MNEANTGPAPTDDAERSAIAALVARAEQAWNRGDAQGYAEAFSPDGSFTNIIGMTFHGREAFERRHAEVFATIFKGSVARFTVAELRFIRPDVAIADLTAEVRRYAGLPPGVRVGPDGVLHTQLQLVLANGSHGWQIEAFHNVAVAPR